MSLRKCVLAAGVASAAGMNLVNRQSGMCLDLHAPCVDGSDDQDCQRMKVKDLKKGTNLQLYTCNGKKNQEFELLEHGRIRNPFTNLCVDIMAPCKDHFRTPCERLPVTDLEGKANIQLYTCHMDVGTLSNSYGNQKWNFQGGQLRNRLSNLCLEPKLDTAGKTEDMANIWARVCHEADYQKFDFLEYGTSSENQVPSQSTQALVPAPVAPAGAVVAPPALPPVPATPQIAQETPGIAMATPPPLPVITAAPLPSMPPLPPLPQAKFEAVPKGDGNGFLEAAGNQQPQLLMGFGCVALVAAAARATWRRAPAEEHGYLPSEE